MTTSVAGKCCLVTGASNLTSIGYLSVKALLDAGAECVTIMGRDNDKVEQAVQSLGKDNVHGVVGDLYKPDTMKDVIEQAATKMGGKLDILVISGGTGGSEYLGLPLDDPSAYHKMYDVAVLSPMMLTRAAHDYLSKDDGGSVVMVSSMSPQVPWPDTAPFNLAKAGQNCLVETLAFEYRNDNIRVNAVLPGCIHTGYLDIMAGKKSATVEEYAALRAAANPVGRNGTPEEVAQAILFLSSPASSYTTGELFKVDGGLHLSNWWNKSVLLDEYGKRK